MANWNIKWNIDGIKKFNGRFFYSNRKYFNIIKQYIYKKKRINKTKTYIHFKYMVGSIYGWRYIEMLLTYWIFYQHDVFMSK